MSRVGVPFGEFAVVGVTHTLRAKTNNGRSATSCSTRYARNAVAQSETMGNRKMSTNDDRGAMARNDILQRAKRGEISPQHAEWEAMDAGCWPLAVQFPPGFDPLGERHWTLFMAAAWIVRRNPNDVRAVWNHYRTKCRKWVDPRWLARTEQSLKAKRAGQ